MDTKPLIERIAQVKLPVTDLATSVAWYTAVLDLRLWVEIVEDDEVRGVGLIDREERFNVSLRLREHCAARPVLSGFDVVAFTPSSREAMDALAERCDRLGVARSAIADGVEGSRLDIPDPDDTVLRFYHFTAPTDGFTGIVMGHDGPAATYDVPRLHVDRLGAGV